MSGDDRHTIVHDVEIEGDIEARAAREASNAVAQFDAVLDAIEAATRSGRRFRLRPSMILDLHRVAMDGVHPLAGSFRNTPVGIQGSSHTPPREHLVPHLVEEMCDWIEDHWADAAVTLCSYVMWRLNWIHPFADGNGRTSRAVAYLVLCARSGFSLPGRRTIPEQIAEHKEPYYQVLERVDASAIGGSPDLSPMEALLTGCLQEQLDSAFSAATNSDRDEPSDRRFH